jgi:MFS family permease
MQSNDIKNPVLFPILIVNFIGTLGFSIVLPFLVFLVTKFGGNALVYGILGATYSAFQLFGAPLLGKWSDIYGRRKILLLSQAGTLVSWIVFLVALFLPVSALWNVDSNFLGEFVLTVPLLILFLARAMDGATGGNVSVANAYLADITEEKDRSRNFGKMAMFSNLGFIFGPALAGILGATAFGETLPVLAALVISLAATIIIAFYLPESRPCVLKQDPEQLNVRKVFGQEQRECFELKSAEKISFRDVIKLKGVTHLLLINFLVFLGFNLFYTAFPIHAVKGLKWSVTDMGLFFSTLSFLMVIVQGPILSKASKRFSDSVLAISGSLILATNFILLTSTYRPVIFSAALFFALGNGLMWPSLLSLISKSAGPKYQGSVQGFSGSIGSLASIIGLVAGGILYDSLQETTFLLSAVIIFVVFLLSFRLKIVERKIA